MLEVRARRTQCVVDPNACASGRPRVMKYSKEYSLQILHLWFVIFVLRDACRGA